MVKVHPGVGRGADFSCGIVHECGAGRSGSIDGEGTSWSWCFWC